MSGDAYDERANALGCFEVALAALAGRLKSAPTYWQILQPEQPPEAAEPEEPTP